MLKKNKKILMIGLSVIVLLMTLVHTSSVYAAEGVVSVSYRTHVQDIGWQDYVTDGAVSGTSGQSKRLEAINIQVTGDANLGIKYSTHVQDIGWQEYAMDGNLSGTSGQSKRLEAIKIALTGIDSANYDVYYRVHAEDYGWLDWAKNGEAAGTEGLSKRLEAIQITIVAKGTDPGLATSRPFVSSYGIGDITYRTHVQDIGWQSYVADGVMSGTSGQSKRLEAINIHLNANMPSGSVVYQTHVQDYGWMAQVSDGAMSGTSGQSKRLEAIRINLTGEIAAQYDIYYRVHVQNAGWLDWAKNGQDAGSTGLTYRLEGIQIKLVPKGGAAPGSTEKPFINSGWQTVNERKYYFSQSGVSKLGIDVSKHNGVIDWEKVKNDGIDFAIIRIGIGDDLTSQDDPQAIRNMNECERLGIPYGVYLYSYAMSVGEVPSEVRHTLRMISGRNPQMGVFFDMEDADDYKAKRGMPSNTELNNICISFLNQIANAGYKVGLYSNTYWFTNVLTDPRLNNYGKWVAQYNDTCTYKGNYVMWQYTSSGSVNGISGNVDMNVKFN